MVHCPECEATLAEASDLQFEETESKFGLFKASKRFYVASCADCGATIGSGVVAARGGGGAGGADAA